METLEKQKTTTNSSLSFWNGESKERKKEREEEREREREEERERERGRAVFNISRRKIIRRVKE